MNPAYTFRSFEGPRHQSKYEQRGKAFLEDLRQLRKRRCSPIHRHQLDAVLNTHRFLVNEANNTKRNGPILIVAPTGSGKSGMIFMLPYVLQSRKVLVITPSAVISDQIGATFGLENHPCFLQKLGIANDSKELQGFLENGRIIRTSMEILPDKLVNLVIVNAQKFGGKSRTTLSLMYCNQEIIKDVQQFFREFDTLIIDEAHHFPANTWINIVREFHKPVDGMTKQSIFLTATPNKTLTDGTQQPILPRQRIAYEITAADLEGTIIRKTKFVEKYDVCHIYDNLQKCLRDNKKLEKRIKHQAMILVRTKKEAIETARRLNRWSRNLKYAVPLVSDRLTVKQDEVNFMKGEYTVAVTCGLLKEGYDNCNVTVVVIMRNVSAKVLFEQFIGRCMRKRTFLNEKPDQSVATILSYDVFKQRQMWEGRKALAKCDPWEIDDGVKDEKPKRKA